MKFNWKKIVAGAVTVASAVALLAGSSYLKPATTAHADSNASTVSTIKKRGTLRVAVFGDLPPYGWVNKDGKRVGYDVELARRMAKDLGVKPKFVQVNANNRVDTLNSNKADIVLANFTVTPDRKKVVDFANPYMKVSVGVVSPKKKEIGRAHV